MSSIDGSNHMGEIQWSKRMKNDVNVLEIDTYTHTHTPFEVFIFSDVH